MNGSLDKLCHNNMRVDISTSRTHWKHIEIVVTGKFYVKT